MTTYIYQKEDFTSVVSDIDLIKLKAAVNSSESIYTTLTNIISGTNDDGTVYGFEFDSDLSESEEAALDTVVATYSNLQDYREAAFAKIDDAAGRTRARYVTTSPGQDAVYTLKAAEAEAYKGKGYPNDTSKYKFIEAEMAATGMSAKDVADMLVQIKSQWIVLAAYIEQVRLSGKNTIKTKTTKAEIDAIVNQTVGILDSI